MDFPVYFVTRGSKAKLDLILTSLCDFYTIFDNFFDQCNLLGHLLSFVLLKLISVVLIKVNFKECCVHSFFLRTYVLGHIFWFFIGEECDFKIFCKNAASASTFKFCGVTVLGHIFLGRPWGEEFTVR